MLRILVINLAANNLMINIITLMYVFLIFQTYPVDFFNFYVIIINYVFYTCCVIVFSDLSQQD